MDKMQHIIKTKSEGIKTVELTPIKANRYQCLYCIGLSAYEFMNCADTLCSLFPYRFGNNPECKE